MVRVSCFVTCCLLGALLLVVPAASYPRYPSNYYREDRYDNYEPDDIVNMLTRLNNLIEMERKMETYNDEIPSYKDDITSAKRALDLGLSRGYSGAVHAKHLMGIQAANFAGGPGRRRRSQ